jgi:CRISPR/Cas system CSM-associated protein Csm4 (group 5 of RAMP superfamily)
MGSDTLSLVPYKKEKSDRDKHIGQMPHESKRWGDASESQGTQQIARDHSTLRRNQPCSHLYFILLASRMETMSFWFINEAAFCGAC